MPADPTPLPDPAPKTHDQLIADLFRENERLQRQVEDARHERDQYKKMFLGELSRTATNLTAEDIAAAVPAEPFIAELIRRLEKK